MSLTIIKKPEVSVPGTSFVSNWNAVHNPIFFELGRRDFTIDSIIDNGSGKPLITTTQEFDLSEIAVGNSLTFFDDVYKGTFEVISSNPPFEFTIETAFISNAVGYILNDSWKNWHLITEVLIYNQTLLIYEKIGELISTEDLNNNIKINVAPVLKTAVSMNDKQTFKDGSPAFFNDFFNSGKFSIRTTRFYNEEQKNTIDEIIFGDFFFLNSARQIQQNFGSNLAENLLIDSLPSIPAKWLSAFERPTLFLNYPFSVSFIKNSDITDNFFIKEFKDSNGNIILTQKTPINISESFFRFRVLNDVLNLSASSFLNLRIEKQDPSILSLTEDLIIDIDSTCKSNAVYLNWLNVDGSRNFWLFDKLQTIGLETQSGGTFERYEEDLENSQGGFENIEITALNKMILGAFVPIDKIKGIKTLLYSMNVLMLMNPGTWQIDGAKWQKVNPVFGSFALYDTDQINGTIQFEIRLSETNIQAQ